MNDKKKLKVPKQAGFFSLSPFNMVHVWLFVCLFNPPSLPSFPPASLSVNHNIIWFWFLSSLKKDFHLMRLCHQIQYFTIFNWQFATKNKNNELFDMKKECSRQFVTGASLLMCTYVVRVDSVVWSCLEFGINDVVILE